MNKQKKLKEKRVEGIESVYMFRSSDDGSDSFCGLGKDGILINIIKVDIGGDIKARHLIWIWSLCLSPSCFFFFVREQISVREKFCHQKDQGLGNPHLLLQNLMLKPSLYNWGRKSFKIKKSHTCPYPYFTVWKHIAWAGLARIYARGWQDLDHPKAKKLCCTRSRNGPWIDQVTGSSLTTAYVLEN